MSLASARTVRFILEARYLGGLIGDRPYLGSSACQAQGSHKLWTFFTVLGHRRNLGYFRGPRSRNLGDFRGRRTTEISKYFEVLGHRRNLGHSRGRCPAGTSDTFEVLAAGISDTFEELAPQKSPKLSRSSDTAGISDTFEVPSGPYLGQRTVFSALDWT